jgi:NAD(P)-dependent dehydrogenase (short-subunit alcohol dehydrogenase family)
MKTVVITGSTRGIGYGLAESFLERGCSVVVSGRTQAAVEQAVTALAKKHPAERICGQACDMGVFEQVQALWDAAVKKFGRVDIWINNAGMSNPMLPFWEQTPERLRDVVNTNLLGAMYGSKVAIAGMLKQGGGHLYNMEGFGSDGGMRVGLTPYGTTKYGVRYFIKALIAETQNTPVKVSTLSPGIVITDLLMDGYVGRDADKERAKRVFNILGDKVETVTPYLAQKVLENDKAGARIAWLTFPKIAFRFATAGFNKRNLFSG